MPLAWRLRDAVVEAEEASGEGGAIMADLEARAEQIEKRQRSITMTAIQRLRIEILGWAGPMQEGTVSCEEAVKQIDTILRTALRAVEQETWEKMKQAKGVIALIACANCTHQERGDSACAACIGDAVKGWPDRRCAAGGTP